MEWTVTEHMADMPEKERELHRKRLAAVLIDMARRIEEKAEAEHAKS